jgi:hypothetical protein
MSDVTALVTPSVLRWARKRAGYSTREVAARPGVDAPGVFLPITLAQMAVI